MSQFFLELTGISKDFGGIKALQEVGFLVEKGKIHYLAGENGSGKSTLIKIISGVYQPNSGQIQIEDQVYDKLQPAEAIKHGIQVIYQDFSIFPNLTVAENININRYLLEDIKRVDWKENRQVALDIMKRLGIQLDPDLLVENLNVGNKQLVAICRALVNDVKLLILDEPTTALTASEVNRLIKVLSELKAQGIAIVIVDHKSDEVFQYSDEITVLRNGKKVINSPRINFDTRSLNNYLLGKEVEDFSYYRPEALGEEMLAVKNLSSDQQLMNVSFSLKKGEILGITGLLDSGRRELGEALFGLKPSTADHIVLNNKEITINSIQDALEENIAYLPEDRLTEGLFMNRNILDNVVASSVKKFFQRGRLNRQEMAETTNKWIDKLSIKAPGPQTPVSDLSGGNAQKVLISKWLNTHPDLLILNGPTVGVDIGSKAEIHNLLMELAEEGVGIIIISDDLAEIMQICNRVIVMWEGQIKDNVQTADINENVLTDAIGQPQAIPRGGMVNV